MSDESLGRVLVVDDDARIRMMVADYLEEQGFETLEATDGDAALEHLAGGSFDLVLSDVRMPGLDGISLVRMVADLDPRIPVILVTGESVFDTAVQAIQHGAFDYIVKPFSLSELDNAVQRALERRKMLLGAGVGQAPSADASQDGSAAAAATGDGSELLPDGAREERLRAAAERFRATVNEAVDTFLAALDDV